MTGSRFFAVVFAVSGMMLVADSAQADRTHAVTMKAGMFSWQDPDQQTAGEVVEYEPRSAMIAMGFERRRHYIALGGEIFHFASQWKARAPVYYTNGELDVTAINFVARKYFSLPVEIAPFVGLGIGWADIDSNYSTGSVDYSRTASAPVYQVNAGAEWRWEGFSLMAELKYLQIDISEGLAFGGRSDFPQPEGYVGLVGMGFIF